MTPCLATICSAVCLTPRTDRPGPSLLHKNGDLPMGISPYVGRSSHQTASSPTASLVSGPRVPAATNAIGVPRNVESDGARHMGSTVFLPLLLLSAETGTNLPSVDLGAGRKAVAVSAGLIHTCALLVPSLLLSSLELSDTKVDEPQMRALLGTASHYTLLCWRGHIFGDRETNHCRMLHSATTPTQPLNAKARPHQHTDRLRAGDP